MGAGPSGVAAGLAARESDGEADITILSKEKYFPHRQRALISIIEKKTIDIEEKSVWPNDLLRSMRIRYLHGLDVSEVNARSRKLTANAWHSSKKRFLKFDSLVLATGAVPWKPPIPGSNKTRVFTLRTFADALEILRRIKKGRDAVVIGGGFVGMAVARALHRQGMKVSLCEILPHILSSVLEPDLSQEIEQIARSKGLTIYAQTKVEEIGGNDKVRYVKADGKRIKADLVVFATGVRPDTLLAEKANIKCGKNGIKTDQYKRTSSTKIFACGACSETTNFVTQKKTYLPLASVAFEEGKIAGRNAAGNKMMDKGHIRMQNENIFGVDVVSIGCSPSQEKGFGKLTTVDFAIPSLRCQGLRKPYQIIKYFKESGTDKLVGGQTLSRKYAPRYPLDLLRFIKERRTLTDLLREQVQSSDSLEHFMLWQAQSFHH